MDKHRLEPWLPGRCVISIWGCYGEMQLFKAKARPTAIVTAWMQVATRVANESIMNVITEAR